MYVFVDVMRELIGHFGYASHLGFRFVFSIIKNIRQCFCTIHLTHF